LACAKVGQRAGVHADCRPLRSPALVARANFIRSRHSSQQISWLSTEQLNQTQQKQTA